MKIPPVNLQFHDLIFVKCRVIPNDLQEPVRKTFHSRVSSDVLETDISVKWTTTNVTSLRADGKTSKICGDSHVTLTLSTDLQCRSAGRFTVHLQRILVFFSVEVKECLLTDSSTH